MAITFLSLELEKSLLMLFYADKIIFIVKVFWFSEFFKFERNTAIFVVFRTLTPRAKRTPKPPRRAEIWVSGENLDTIPTTKNVSLLGEPCINSLLAVKVGVKNRFQVYSYKVHKLMQKLVFSHKNVILGWVNGHAKSRVVGKNLEQNQKN